MVGTGVITVYSERTDYTTSNLIFVSLAINNPQTTSITFNMYLYSYYYSASRFALSISRSTTFSIDNSWSSNVRIAK